MSSAALAHAFQDSHETARAFVASVGSATKLPAFVKNVRSISSVASNTDARVKLLEEAISRDIVLTARILRIANMSVQRQGIRIATLKQAIMLLGYERVQTLSASAAVFDQLDHTAEAVQDLMVFSVLVANQCLCLAVEAEYGRPEMAYLCGLFNNLGEVIVACYRGDDYRAWLETHTDLGYPPPGSEVTTFGFTFEQVAVLLAEEWAMPAEMVQTLRRVPPTEEAPADRLQYITQFGAALARSTFGGALPETCADEVRALISQYAAPLRMNAESIAAAQAEVRRSAKPTLQMMSITVEDWEQSRRERLLAMTAPTEADLLAELDAIGRSNPTDTPTEAGVRSLLGALAAQRKGETEFTVATVSRAILDASHLAGFKRSVLALSTPDFSAVRGRIGSGVGFEPLLHVFALRPKPAYGPLGGALSARLDLFVDTQADSGRPFRRDMLLRELRPRCFALLPLVLEEKLIGCLYFDNGDDPVHCTDVTQSLLRAARDHLTEAFARHRRGAAA
jgi:HD-like signal output (HDOD) protein